MSRVGFDNDRSVARDRPSPYDSGGILITVARGPVPRDRSARQSMARACGCHCPSPYDLGDILITVARGPVPRALSVRQSMARDRSSPYDSGGILIPVARGPVSRDRSRRQSMARDRPSPYGNRRITITIGAWRGTGPRPTVTSENKRRWRGPMTVIVPRPTITSGLR